WRISMKTLIAVLLIASTALLAQAPPAGEQDAYTRIALGDPATSAFKVTHEVAVTTVGAKQYELPLWPGTQTTGLKVTDLMSGAPLATEARIVKGMPAGGDSNVAAGAVRVTLARPVPKDGQGRVRFEYEARNGQMFKRSGQTASFTWPVRSPRGTIVLPAGYELLSSDVPAQILSEADGRISVSYMHQIAGDATMTLTMRAGVPTGAAAAPKALTNARSWEAAGQKPAERARLTERATQDRDIVYFLQEPSTNAFSLYHDYTESRPGIDKYVNVVRAGSTVSKPSAYILDTGEVLRYETLKGDAITAAKIEAGTVTPETEVVVIHFTAVKEGQSVRLRLSETYTHPESYRLDGSDLVFERNLGRARNSVVLPAGWYLTASSIPAVVRQTPDGLTRLDFVNGRPEGIDVYVKGRKR
ncbi:MAG: hypothetical protein ABIP90_08720, partial [Vicinamibacterales bacterium]